MRVGQRRVAADEDLADERLARLGRLAERGIVGRHRAPAEEVWPSDWTICSKRSSRRRRLMRSRGRNTRPAAVLAGLGQARCRLVLQASLKKACGIWISTPAPSPVFASQPEAPRWSRLVSTSIACWRIRLDLRPLMSTTKPTPQASCSNHGIVEALLLGQAGGPARGRGGMVWAGVHVLDGAQKKGRSFGARAGPRRFCSLRRPLSSERSGSFWSPFWHAPRRSSPRWSGLRTRRRRSV